MCALTATTWSQPVGPPNVGSLCCTCAPPQTNYSVCVTHTARPRPECSNQSRGPWDCLCLCVFPSQPLGAIIVVTVAEPGGDLPLTSCCCVCVCVLWLDDVQKCESSVWYSSDTVEWELESVGVSEDLLTALIFSFIRGDDRDEGRLLFVLNHWSVCCL